MKRFVRTLLQSFGVLFFILLLGGYGFYFYLFERDYPYFPVEDSEVLEKLDKWQDHKFGLFMHWGTYSQWGIVESWSICAEDEGWCTRTSSNYLEYKTAYEGLKKTFNPTAFDPDRWARAANEAGMKYVVFTTKHHDGFCMFDTQTTDYKITSPDCPFSANPKANITKEVFNSFRNEGFMIGAYYSKPDWNSEYFWWPNFATPDRNVNYRIDKYPERWQNYVSFTHQQVDELMTNYGSIDILWLDGGWVRPLTQIERSVSEFTKNLFASADYTQLNAPQSQDMDIAGMAASARKKQPGLIVVDRFVAGPEENYLTPENHIPEDYSPYPWETCLTMSGGWSYSPDAQYKSSRELIHSLADVVSKGGNLLLNVGPAPDGTWQDEVYQRLEDIGVWMKINSAAIYDTKGRPKFSDGKVRFTISENDGLNAIYLTDENELVMPESIDISGITISKNTKVQLLGSGDIAFTRRSGGITLHIPKETALHPPCRFAWSFHISEAH